MKLIKILFILGISIGTIGQLVWSIIFWNNNNLFIYHWFVGYSGLIPIIISLFILKKHYK